MREQTFLSQKYSFRYNVIANTIEFSKLSNNLENDTQQELEYVTLTDYDFNTVFLELRSAKMDISHDMFRYILNSNFAPKYNPFENYFESLPVWTNDQPDFIQQLANCVPVANRERWLLYLKRWLIAVVACALDGKAINQHILILKGGQGVGKTTFIQMLTPHSLKEYYIEDSVNPNNKDSKIQLTKALIFNLDELENISQRNLSGFKRIVTTIAFNYRKPYGIIDESFPRRVSFAGTINTDHFLKDQTGNRRYLITEVNGRIERLDLNIDLVYSQALALFRAGERFYFDEHETLEIQHVNKEYQLISTEEEVILKHLEPVVEENDRTKVSKTATEITKILCRFSGLPCTEGKVQKVGTILKQLKFRSRKSNGSNLYDFKYKNFNNED